MTEMISSSTKFTEDSVNFGFKAQTKSLFECIEFLCSCFRAIRSHGDDFMTWVGRPNKGTITPTDEDNLYRFIIDQISYLYFGMPALCKFLQKQEASYRLYLKETHLAKTRDLVIPTIEIDRSVLYHIYESDWSDIMNNIYLSLQTVVFMSDHFDELTAADNGSVDTLFHANDSYSHITIDTISVDSQEIGNILLQVDKLEKCLTDALSQHGERGFLEEKIIWRGTSAELAYLFEQLSFKGYIDNPMSPNGEMNKTRLARQVWKHIMTENSKEETLIIDMRGSRLSDSSSFAKAVDLIPRNKKG